jgi:NADP-dependent aldehyde dehydrogenase
MQIQEYTAAQILAAVTAAANVSDDWAQSSAQTRAALLRGLSDVLVANREELVLLAARHCSPERRT